MQKTDDQDVAAAGEPVSRLQQLVAGIRGVNRVEVDLREDGSPHIRVWLDGSASDDDVGAEIQQILASIPDPDEDAEQPTIRRSGLGRGLNELLAANGESQPLPHFAPVHEPAPDVVTNELAHLVLVAVEESAGGIAVRVADSDRGVAFSPVEDSKSLNQAVTSAVARLRQRRPSPRLAGVEVKQIADESVLTVVLLLEDGEKVSGAEIVRGGLPFTLGRAVWKALAFAE